MVSGPLLVIISVKYSLKPVKTAVATVLMVMMSRRFLTRQAEARSLSHMRKMKAL